ncbi:DUF3772 domain-containing protein [Photobacterium sp. 1_MG-2023]|uniref:DUF3772 domain-containing protein n=1 Tax=Photobacterium sp. 1_MG-2023 TaxID=3062646 RepID=UPI0026E39854|nr:DUF3772 domain-containing protein [Photobacterium sp. 1_MG-2023]MDO6704706.1 DUF3772 domain-containing protein [Photobacterium sp. 1_MG-2023]
MQQRMRPFVCGLVSLLVSWCALAEEAALTTLHQKEPYLSWDQTASNARQLLREPSAETAALEQLRATLADQRAEAYQLSQDKSVDVRWLEAQIKSLGPEPKDGDSEPEVIASRRAELENELATASAPIFLADAAYERANLLVGEIDQQIRQQLADKLLTKSPTPLWPGHWGDALRELKRYASQLRQEFRAVRQDAKQNQAMTGSILPFVALTGLAVLIMLLVQPWAINLLDRFSRSLTRKSTILVCNLFSTLLRLVFPLLTAMLLLTAISVLKLPLASAQQTLQALGAVAFYIVLSHWLGFLIFRPKAPEQRIIQLDSPSAREGMRICQLLGLFLGLIVLLTALKGDYSFSAASSAILTLPAILLGSWLMWRLAQLLSQAAHSAASHAQDSEQGSHVSRGILNALIWLMKTSSVLSVVFVCLGYDSLARQAIIPMVMSIALLAFAMVIYYGLLNLMARIFTRDTREEDAGPSESLLPIVLIVIIFFLFAPALALIWGARLTDIAEVWRLLSDGIELGDVRLSLDVIITFFVVLFAGILLTRWIQYVLRNSVLPKTKTDPGARTAIVTGLGYVGYTLSIIIAVSAAGLNLSSLAVVAGALSVGIGFGLQTIVSNFVSGIILLIERPIKEGDWIEVSGHSGFVRKIAVRSTRIETFDLQDVVVPNSDLIAGIVKNMTLRSNHGRLVVSVGVAYGSDLNIVKEVLMDAAKNHAMVLSYPAPSLVFTSLGDSALQFELRCFIRDIKEFMVVKSDLLFDIYQTLTDKGVSIPFPQRDVSIKGLEALVKAWGGERGVER